MDESVDNLFDDLLPHEELLQALSQMHFLKIGEGSEAHVFGDSNRNIVLKIFPPIGVGNVDDIQFIDNSYILRRADILTLKYQNIRLIKWLRQWTKTVISHSLSKKDDHFESRRASSESSIKSYETSIKKGLMENLFTRVIPNFLNVLSVDAPEKTRKFLIIPDKIVLQKRYNDNQLMINVLKGYALDNNLENCDKLIKDAANYQIYLWEHGVTNSDLSFNMLDSLLLLPNGKLQLHDANGIYDSYKTGKWYVYEKEKDIAIIWEEIKKGSYPQFLFKSHRRGISEYARKLYSLLPRKNRDEIVMIFLKNCQDVLSINQFTTSWNRIAGRNIEI